MFIGHLVFCSLAPGPLMCNKLLLLIVIYTHGFCGSGKQTRYSPLSMARWCSRMLESQLGIIKGWWWWNCRGWTLLKAYSSTCVVPGTGVASSKHGSLGVIRPGAEAPSPVMTQPPKPSASILLCGWRICKPSWFPGWRVTGCLWQMYFFISLRSPVAEGQAKRGVTASSVWIGQVSMLPVGALNFLKLCGVLVFGGCYHKLPQLDCI